MDGRVNERVDVVVVGCGPAGNVAAWHLARRGLAVRMLERESLPRRKVCGGGLTRKALDALPFDVSPVVHRRMVGARVRVGRGDAIDLDRDDTGATIERAEFDAYMTRQAQAQGVRVSHGTRVVGVELDADRVRVRTDRGDVDAALLIGADGARSAVRASLFPDWSPRWAFAVEACWHGPVDAHEGAACRAAFEFGAIGDGYGWVFPKRDHWNVGVYRVTKPRGDTRLRPALDAFAGSRPELDGCAADAARGHPIPVADARQPLARGRAILAGDAAGLAEGFFGEGIAYALRSGRIAADWAAESLERGGFRPRRPYADAVAPLRDDLVWSWRLARVLYALPPAALRRIVASPRAQDAMLGLLTGRLGYRDGLRRLVLGAPRVLLARLVG